ncbi:MAG TPA: M48 family metalloprotease [Micromonosporaceae bacterium]|jgi:hypothetical protein
MIASTAAYLLLTVIFALSGPALARRVPPAWSVRLMVPTALAFAGAGLFVLGANAMTWAAQRPDVAELGDWSTSKLRLHDPVPPTLALVAASLLAASVFSMTILAVRRARALRSIRHMVPAGGGDVVLLEDERVDAFTTPGRSGRIIVTSGLMNALTAPERVAVLAHERSHRRHRHAWWILAADLAAATNPLLRPIARSMAHTVERWADEDAATDVGDRRVVARAVARASLLHKRGLAFATAVALAATGGNMPLRVRALLETRPRRNAFAAGMLVLMALGAVAAVMAMQRCSDALFDASQQ